MNRKDGFAAFGFLAMGLLALLKALQLPFGTFRTPDVAFFPVLLSSLLILLSLILLGRSLWVKLVKPDRIHPGEHWKRLIPILAALVAYCFLVQPLGYIICTVLVTIFIAKLVHCSWREAFSISILSTIVAYVLIVVYLKSPLPRGIVPF